MDGLVTAQSYTSPHTYVPSFPPRAREEHGARIKRELEAAIAAGIAATRDRDPAIMEGTEGYYIEVVSAPRIGIPDGFETKTDGTRISAVKTDENGGQRAAVFVTADKANNLITKVDRYLTEDTKTGKPERRALIEPVDAVSPGTIEALWTDHRPLPDPFQPIWWEIWTWPEEEAALQNVCGKLNIVVSNGNYHLKFPEITIIQLWTDLAAIENLLVHTSAVSELRCASDTPHVLATMFDGELDLIVDDIADRVRHQNEEGPAVCVLDTGVNRAHPLLMRALAEEDCYAVDERWGTADSDRHGHGTKMAGIALLGDLAPIIRDVRQVNLEHLLESVKILPPDGFDPNNPHSYGSITKISVSLPEIAVPGRARAFCLAITNQDVSGERNTSWSAAIDQICAGVTIADDQVIDPQRPGRLFLASSGNIPDDADPSEMDHHRQYPTEDPAQAWNAITVGGYTNLNQITEPDLNTHVPISAPGESSPYSRASIDWPRGRTPIKPEIVLEAGNRAQTPAGTDIISGAESLSLLSTGHEVETKPIDAFWATSPATAEAARLTASIMAAHPELWPETIRSLLVHSASWTEAMQERLNTASVYERADIHARHFGYGVPSLDRALASATNDLAIISQGELQPFANQVSVSPTGARQTRRGFGNMDAYDLPIPTRTLQGMENATVRLKVTLSYFIVPNPGKRAAVMPYRYRSFGLRFDLKRRNETISRWRARLNKQARDDSELHVTGEADSGWVFGPTAVSAGSLHCDVWEGPAIELASRGQLAVYPVGGWWRERRELIDRKVRYSLIASLSAPGMDVDLYTEVQQRIATEIEATVNINV